VTARREKAACGRVRTGDGVPYTTRPLRPP